MTRIDNFNRDLIIQRYVEDIVGGLHFLDTKIKLKECLLQQKYSLSDGELEYEIMRNDPGLLSDLYLEEMFEEVSHA